MARRLAAILAADMVGYSRLMTADEGATLARQRRHRTEVIEPRISEYGGRIVKTTGDGFLAEFPSVVDAVRSAVMIQISIADHEAVLPEDERILYRIGVNLGDIVVEDTDIYGEGVIVAARLEALAEPGAIYVSRTVVNHIRGRIASQFEDLGTHEVKNIPEPIHIYRVDMAPEQGGVAATATVRAPRARRLTTRTGMLAGGLVLAAALLIGWQVSRPGVDRASIDEMVYPLPDKPSLAVLPFANLSGSDEQEYLADGITSDLITDLSKFQNLFVIAANSTFTYKGKPVKVQEVAEDLGVQYVLEGSVQRLGKTIRINAQLIDALSGRHLWADRYNDDLDDLLAVQDRVVEKVVLELAVELEAGERSRSDHPAGLSVENYELFRRARAILPTYFADKNDVSEARELFEKLAVREPDFAGAYAGLSRCYSLAVLRGYTRDRDLDAMKALDLAEKARLIDPEGEYTRLALADAQLAAGRLEEAIATLKALMQDAPSSADAHGRLGLLLVWAGRARDAFDHIDAAIRLDPFVGSPYLNYLGLAEFSVGRYDAAVATFEKNAARGGPIDDAGLAVLTASYNELGRTAEAQATLERLIDRYPGAHLRSFWLLRVLARPEDRTRFTETFQRAEIPMDRPYTR